MAGKGQCNLLEYNESRSMDRFCTSTDETLLTDGLTKNQFVKYRFDFDPSCGLQNMVQGCVGHNSAWWIVLTSGCCLQTQSRTLVCWWPYGNQGQLEMVMNKEYFQHRWPGMEEHPHSLKSQLSAQIPFCLLTFISLAQGSHIRFITFSFPSSRQTQEQ